VSSDQPQPARRGSRIAAIGGVVVIAGGLGWFALSHVVMRTPAGDAAGEALGVMLGLLVVTSVLGAILGNRSGNPPNVP
jgi:enamine deaminase RidA (YjgF/YER057c/UK114 family)